MSSFQGLYNIRESNENDKNFILATFLKGLYYGDSWFSQIPKDVFMDNYKKVALHLINNNKVFVACLKEDPDVILGYSILTPDLTTLHWVFVKSGKRTDGSTWRLKGIGRSLVPNTVTTTTHLTKLGISLLPKLNIIFNPFKI